MRTIAAAIGVSHTTVAVVLNGHNATAWKSVEKVARYLELDLEETRALWVAQRAEDAQRLRRSGPGSGQVSELAELLEETNALLHSVLDRVGDILAAVKPVRTFGGVELTDEVLDAAAEETERGYAPSQIRPRSGRSQK